jgi:hypothetical protein
MSAKKKNTNKTRGQETGAALTSHSAGSTKSSAATKLIVISRGGKLVGTYLPGPPPAEPNAPRATLVAGPGQRLHEIDIENPESFHQRRAIPELHKLIRKQLKLK